MGGYPDRSHEPRRGRTADITMSNCSEDTGVDELGYAARTPWQPCVSAKWREQQLKHAFSITLGKMLQNGPTASGDVEVPYLKAQHVQWDEIRVFDLPRMWASSAEIDALQLRKGDLLVCEGGDVGRSTILRSLPQDPYYNPECVTRRSRSKWGRSEISRLRTSSCRVSRLV